MDRLRTADKVVLSLVAVLEEDVVGHILFTKVSIGDSAVNALGLGPMAVLPELQHQGIGTRLLGEALERCRFAGYECVVVVGHPEYYPRFGFVPASRWGLHYEGVPDEAFMALELQAGVLETASGRVGFQPEFDAAS